MERTPPIAAKLEMMYMLVTRAFFVPAIAVPQSFCRERRERTRARSKDKVWLQRGHSSGWGGRGFIYVIVLLGWLVPSAVRSGPRFMLQPHTACRSVFAGELPKTRSCQPRTHRTTVNFTFNRPELFAGACRDFEHVHTSRYSFKIISLPLEDPASQPIMSAGKCGLHRGICHKTISSLLRLL